ncbi:DNA polymerase III subunit gamma/tau [Desertifilum sp. FACHB-1129]|uniref:DNA polymerase III subunit gamma/tau n=1 Tax=Desertifilum tharense IPPAS B-1220 TaxID=1781255 RepID=A0A1E5QNB2_9CYAN|nr:MULTISPECIES: DNA polymerase III subunit gamma/tau [Desertifilum]MDA0210259.1 DNA polymerase III subunit gamma/tau [Cyanobacteria bacterium FC1]MBD2310205.1 DNA polymerase III subunit gamma/tau [Desertifilum sp. FACHB-1129]MBD2322581.1 DNA polymerase III subunit gamma/tau [Desertifilum sp. FACHB-866]MBD2334634.1 DNA polymerase III subunit gamma/tau [Desertifilum sp. FACHB-868]OEJ76130.1 DNA polymerase III, subunit gamma and tau [Desertifilum tharense IPPAS B-1220]
MTYEPLHHKYRPQRFRDLVGQEAIATTLTNALQQDKIAPAYLFAGPRGTGKTSSARILAKSLNCLSSGQPTPDPCGQCETCKAITNGSSLDVIEIDAASNTGVDNIRELIERAQFAPVQCRYKIYVLDEVHMLSTASFNALLKTLEEPPDRVVFVLATTDPQRVLPTIISRCQRFDFRRIPLEPMVRHLGNIASKEQIEITPEALMLVAQISQGGLRDAESLLDQLSLLSEEVTPEKVWDLVGSVPERDLLELLKAIASDEGTQVITVIRSILDRGREPLVVLQNLVSFYRDLLIAKSSPQSSALVALTPATWASLCECAQHWTVSEILHSQQHLKTSEVQIKNTTQPRLWLEVTLLGLLRSALPLSQPPQNGKQSPLSQPPQTAPKQSTLSPPPQTAPQNGKESPRTATVSPAPSPVPAPPVAPPPPLESPQPVPTAEPEPADPPVVVPDPQPVASSSETEDAEDLQALWEQALDCFEFYSTKALLSQHGRLLSCKNGRVQIQIEAPAIRKAAKERESQIVQAFEKVLHSPVTVLYVSAMGSTKGSPATHSQRSQPKDAVEPPPQTPQIVESQPPEPSPKTLSSQPAFSAEVSSPPVAQPILKVEVSSESSLTQVQEPVVSNLAPVDSEQVLQVAKNFAEFFKGEVIELNREPGGIEQSTVAPTLYLNGKMQESEAIDDPDEDEEDIPF